LSGLSAESSFKDTPNHTVQYAFGSDLKLLPGQSTRLTLLVDANRLLRFETSIRDDARSVKDGWPKTRPYFYSTTFRDSSFAFLGEPGEIRGYKWGAYACEGAPATCKGASGAFYIEGWLTTLARKGTAPFFTHFMPDDDSTLTTVKGTNRVMKSSQNGMTFEPHERTWTVGADGKTTMTYVLDGKTGTVDIAVPTEKDQIREGRFTGFQGPGGEFELERKL
jgi:hypothetical protein